MRQPARYRTRPLASEDIESIFATIDRDNPAAADRFIAELDRSLKLLAGMPGAGALRRARGRLKGLRSWPLTSFGPYVIFYLPQPDGIEVVRVLHGARNIDRELRKS